MEIWLSGEVDADVGDSSRLSSNYVEGAINSVVKNRTYGSIRLWGAIQIIMDERQGAYEEVTRFWRTKKETEFRLKIDHDTFKHSDETARRRLIFETVLRSIVLARDMKIPNFDLVQFEKDVRSVGQAHRWC